MKSLFLLNIAFVIITGTYKIYGISPYCSEEKVPNGHYIKHTGTECQICHVYADPGDDPVTLNSFGSDFRTYGWSQTLGYRDSDGDGYSNSSELYCYTWTWTSGTCGSDQALVADPSNPDVQPGPAAERIPPARKKDLFLSVPNPFNSAALIRIEPAGEDRFADLSVMLYDNAGRLVRTLPVRAGSGGVVWNGLGIGGKPAPSGIYTARVAVGNRRLVTRLILAR